MSDSPLCSTSRLLIFVIRDKVSGSNSPLFLASNYTHAKREFKTFLASDRLPAPTDFNLECVGEWYPDTLAIASPAEAYPYRVCNGGEVMSLAPESIV